MENSQLLPRPRLVSAIYYRLRTDFVSNDSRFATWVMIVPETGQFVFETDGASGEVGPGAMVIIAPRAQFSRRSLCPIAYHSLTWEYSAPLTADVPVLPAGRAELSDATALQLAQGRLRQLAGAIDPQSRARIQHVLEELLFLGRESRDAAARVLDPSMNEAARLLREAAGRDFPMRSISEAIGLRPVQFTRRFKAAYGVNPVQYLTAQRLEIAQHLLVHTDLHLEEVARRCGWASGYYLSHVFSAQRGMSPGRFRRLHRP